MLRIYNRFWHFFDVLLMRLIIFQGSIHHKDIHSSQVHIHIHILAHVHSILRTANKDQPWGQRWLLLQALLISFFFPSIHSYRDIRSTQHIHNAQDHSSHHTASKDQQKDQLLVLAQLQLISFSSPSIHSYRDIHSSQHSHNAQDHSSHHTASKDQQKDQH